jgi:replication initiation and membrane attachment protein
MAVPANFMPQDDYLVTQAQFLTDLDRKTLVLLYQPIVGAVASALYECLWTQVKRIPLFSKDRHPQTDLLVLLGISFEEFYNARIRLEAVGLIKTYSQVDNGRHYVYEMYAPIAPQKFFDDDVLGICLYKAVGNEQYKRLVQKFTLTPVRRADMHDISKKFSDVFHLTDDYAYVPTDVQSSRKIVQERSTPNVKIGNSKIDFELLIDQSRNIGVSSNEVMRNEETLNTVAGLYGLNTSALGRLVARSLNYDNQIDIDKFKYLADKQFGKSRAARMQQIQAKENLSIRKVNTHSEDIGLKKYNFTSHENTVIQNAYKLPYVEFLEFTKKDRSPNPIVNISKAEVNAIEKMARKNLFNDETLNMLIFAALQGNTPTLFYETMNNIANNWLEKQVDTPEKALISEKEYREGKEDNQNKNSTKKKRYTKQQREEPVPEWANSDDNKVDVPVSMESRKALAKKLAEIRNSSKRGE